MRTLRACMSIVETTFLDHATAVHDFLIPLRKQTTHTQKKNACTLIYFGITLNVQLCAQMQARQLLSLSINKTHRAPYCTA